MCSKEHMISIIAHNILLHMCNIMLCVTGKVFSLASSIDSLMPIAAAPLYTLVYNETFNVMPGAFFLVSAGIFIIDVILLW